MTRPPGCGKSTIAQKGDAFIDAIKKMPDSRLIPVSENTRDALALDREEKTMRRRKPKCPSQ